MPSVLVRQIPSSCPAVQFDRVVMITIETAIPASMIVLVSTGWQMMAKATMVEKKMMMTHNPTMSSKMKMKMRQSQFRLTVVQQEKSHLKCP